MGEETGVASVRMLVREIVEPTAELIKAPERECQPKRSGLDESGFLPPAVDDANDPGLVEMYSSVQEEVLERAGELVGKDSNWDDSVPVEVTPPAEEVELLRFGALLAADDLKEDGNLPVPVGRIDKVAFPVASGALEDEPLAPLAAPEDRGRDPVLVGPTETVKLNGVEYGAEDKVKPPTRLDESGRPTVLVAAYSEVPFPWVYGPTEKLLAPPTKLDELSELLVPVGRRGVVELEVG